MFLGVSARRKRWQAMIGVFALLVALSAGVLACGNGSQSVDGHACGTAVTPGTTAGAYSITVTGISGTTTVSSPITLTVQ